MCEMLAGIDADLNGPSLGAIRPARVADELEFSRHQPWSPEQLAKLQAVASQDSLFGQDRVRMLEPPRFVARLHYWCQTRECGGHQQRIIDWELTALQSHFRDRSDDEVKAAIHEKFLVQVFERDTDPLIFVGNQANPQRRRSFTVLGLYYPRAGDADPGLF